MKNIKIGDIIYKPPIYNRQTKRDKSITVIGLDTEADRKGHCFIICTSLGDSFIPDQFPYFFFTRKYRNKKFVVYNIKYDEGALIQNLPMSKLEELRCTMRTSYNGYKYFSIPHKMLRISKGKNNIEIYDIAGFYLQKLETAASKYLSIHKIDIDPKLFTQEYIKNNIDKIIEYCVNDAVLTERLATLLIKKFESFGVYPQKLYSTAYVSWQYFRTYCKIPLIKNIYDNHKPLLQYAIDSYNGGKFEVTVKGLDNYYEYDLISAYPYEISNLIDIEYARIVVDKLYRKDAVYGFIDCTMKIPVNIYSPIAVKTKELNIYPVGTIRKCITKTEYEYLYNLGIDIKIHNAYWLITADRIYPFRQEIYGLMKAKDRFKREKSDLDYHTIKIFMNSLYGKFVQLIPYKDKYKAGLNWNIIYGSIITANCRVRISEMQQKYKSVVAVHTDSIISTKPLDFPKEGKLGDMVQDVQGKGVILGSGIYQIGDKIRFRGFDSKFSLIDILDTNSNKLKIKKERPLSWREVTFHKWDIGNINLFTDITKNVNINFDTKRIWLNDWKIYKDVLKRKVYSTAIPFFDYFVE